LSYLSSKNAKPLPIVFKVKAQPRQIHCMSRPRRAETKTGKNCLEAASTQNSCLEDYITTSHGHHCWVTILSFRVWDYISLAAGLTLPVTLIWLMTGPRRNNDHLATIQTSSVIVVKQQTKV